MSREAFFPIQSILFIIRYLLGLHAVLFPQSLFVHVSGSQQQTSELPGESVKMPRAGPRVSDSVVEGETPNLHFYQLLR